MNSMIQPISPAVQWFEGMLLSPQHFQQNNLYIEQMMFHQLQRLNPHYYGFLQLSLDNIALADKVITLREVHAIMPDGSVVFFQASPEKNQAFGEQVLDLNLDDLEKPPAMKPFFVYLALAKQRDRDGYEGNDELSRYNMTSQGSVKDLHDRDNQVDVARLELRLQLLTEQQLTSNYSYLPLLQLQRKHDGSYERLDYTPPCLHVSARVSDTPAQSTLWNRIEALLGRLRTKAIEKRDHFTAGNKGPLAHNEKQELLLITQYLPKLQIMLNSNTCHPYDFYLALIEMSSGMSMLLGDGLANDYENYRHSQLDKIFLEPINDIEALVDKLELNFEVLTFTESELSEYHCELGNLNSEPLMVSMRLAPGINHEQLKSWVENAYICSRDKLEGLLLQRVTGLSRVNVEQFERLGIKQSDEEVLFEIALDQDHFSTGQGAELIIKSSDETLNKFKPLKINLLRQRASTR